MAGTLPLRIKQNIRDQIESPTSAFSLQSAIVKKTLSYSLHFDPEWPQLWSALQPSFPDPSTFVPYISNVLVAWCEAFNLWLDDEKNEEEIDRLLEELRSQRVPLVLEISSSTAIRPTTKWDATQAVFTITLPRSAPAQTHLSHAGFSTDFATIFTASDSTRQPISDPATLTMTEELGEWSLGSPISVAMNTPATSAYPIRQQGFSQSAPIQLENLPDLAAIPRPEDLMKRPPYWMVVRQESRTRLTVYSSHSPSLALLETYLKRWCRGEPSQVNRPPMVEVRLHESVFGMGMLNDTLTLEAQRHQEVTPMLILVFIETVLGYALLPTTTGNGSVWEFRRTCGFK